MSTDKEANMRKKAFIAVIAVLLAIICYFPLNKYLEYREYEALPDNKIDPLAFYMGPEPTTFETGFSYNGYNYYPVVLKVLAKHTVPGDDSTDLFEFEVISAPLGPEKGYIMQCYLAEYLNDLEEGEIIFSPVFPMDSWAYPENTYVMDPSYIYRVNGKEVKATTKLGHTLIKAAESDKMADVEAYCIKWLTERQSACGPEIMATVDSFESVQAMEEASDVIAAVTVTDFHAPNDRVYIVKFNINDIIKGDYFDDEVSYIFTSDVDLEIGKKYIVFMQKSFKDAEEMGGGYVLIPAARQGSAISADSPDVAYLLK